MQNVKLTDSTAAQPTPRTKSRRTASRPLGCVIVGCGKVAVKHVRAICGQPRLFVLSGLVDPRPDAAASLLRASGLTAAQAARVKIAASLSGLLADLQPQIPDIAAITTPSGSHYALACTALTAGLHVLVEKPLTLSLAEADALLQLAREQDRRIAVGHIYRFFPLVQELAAGLRQGSLGRILYGDVKVRWGHDQAYYDQAAWRGTWAEDGGALMNQSIHALDLMTWLLGGTVVAASGWIDRQTHRMEAEDLGLAMLRLDNGAYCLIEGTTNTDPQSQEASFFIACTGGEIRAGIRAGRPYVSVRDRSGRKLTGVYLRRFLRRIWRQGGWTALLQLKNPHSALYADLAAAIRAGREPLADGLSGRQAVEQVLAIYASARYQQTVRLPVADFSLADLKDYVF
jgi:predicted dehydrogenase